MSEEKPKSLADYYPGFKEKPKLVVVLSGAAKAPGVLTDAELVEAIEILTAEHKRRMEKKP